MGHAVVRPGPRGGSFTVADGEVDLDRDRLAVARIQRGDRSGFDELYSRYERRIYRYCLVRLRESHDAEDAAQESFARAWKAMANFRGERRFYPWLTVIASNVCTDVLRSRNRLSPVADIEPLVPDTSMRDIDEDLVRQVDLAMANEALEKLPDRYKRVIKLREGSGWSAQEIADFEGVNLPTAETLLCRARQALRKEVDELVSGAGRLAGILGIGLLSGFKMLRRKAGVAAAKSGSGAASSAFVVHPAMVLTAAVMAAGVVGGAVAMSPAPPSPVASVAGLGLSGNASASHGPRSQFQLGSQLGKAKLPLGSGSLAQGFGNGVVGGPVESNSGALGSGTSGSPVGTGGGVGGTPVLGGGQLPSSGAPLGIGKPLSGSGSGISSLPILGTALGPVASTPLGVVGKVTQPGTSTNPSTNSNPTSSTTPLVGSIGSTTTALVSSVTKTVAPVTKAINTSSISSTTDPSGATSGTTPLVPPVVTTKPVTSTSTTSNPLGTLLKKLTTVGSKLTGKKLL